MHDDAGQLLLDVRGEDMAALVSRNHRNHTGVTALDRIISSLNSSSTNSFNNFISADSDSSIG
jgi:hypothetical protein